MMRAFVVITYFLIAQLVAVNVEGIQPDAGPVSGGTRVIVRGGPFENLEKTYPRPKCKFGSFKRVVNATYVKCSNRPVNISELEPSTLNRTATCLQCDDAPANEIDEIVPFSISLVGDFSDCQQNRPYRYYLDPIIRAIYPKYGPKNGETRVEVWGENFLNFDQNVRCSFGTRSVPANFINSMYLTCFSPPSDIVDHAMPFAITLNDQQFSKMDVPYWYYNKPTIFQLIPNKGPDNGGTHVLLLGSNFNPFGVFGDTVNLDETFGGSGTRKVNNTNDTFCTFGQLGKVPAKVINSTKAICISPPSYVLREVPVEITLNNQQHTDDGVLFHYYRPPYVYEVSPKLGPVNGSTQIKVIGSNFHYGNITCRFGSQDVNGTYLNSNEILCVSPKADKPGYVPLQISINGDEFSTEAVKYLFYDTPIITKIEPTCGPERGYTQLRIIGENFVDTGFDMVKCIFNGTIFMNATIMEHDIIKCSTPSVLNKMGVNDKNVKFYDVQVTLNNKDPNEQKFRFCYYHEEMIKSVYPISGPVDGGNIVKITGKYFKPTCACNYTIRFATYQLKPINFTEEVIYAVAPKVNLSDDVVVAIGINGQQFCHDYHVNFKDIENNYFYFDKAFISSLEPDNGPSSGNTQIVVNGQGFTPFKRSISQSDSPIYCRFRDVDTNKTTNATETEKLRNDFFTWRTPPGIAGSRQIFEYSFNNINFWPILQAERNYSFSYYQCPEITSLEPPYGPVKSDTKTYIKVNGKNFICPNSNCNKVLCRFGNEKEAIYIKAESVKANEITCLIPNYTKPDVLPVEITLNGNDFTNNGYTYGYYDPYILKVNPKMVSFEGNSTITIHGFGFVNSMQYLKVRYGFVSRPLLCGGRECIKKARFINKDTLEVETFAQKDMVYADTGESINNDEFAVEVSVFQDKFTTNNVTIFYFSVPTYERVYPNEVPSNLNDTVYVPTNYLLDKAVNPNKEEWFRKDPNVTCRYKSLKNGKILTTSGSIEKYPLQDISNAKSNSNGTINAVLCKTPQWPMAEDVDREKVQMDIAVNGIDYYTAVEFYFTEKYEIFRVFPRCGPTIGNTRIRVVGTGLTNSDNMYLKWGVHTTTIWRNDTLQADFFKSKRSQVEEEELALSLNDDFMPDINITKKYTYTYSFAPEVYNWSHTMGGPMYLELGKYTEFKVMENRVFRNYIYGTNFLEYFYYKQPVFKDMKPKGGLIAGGTTLIVKGAWFKYRPEYGVIPHIKIGDKISTCEFESTVRIICKSPPNNLTGEDLTVGVSLNGFDFVENPDIKFHYYYDFNISKIIPSSGPESGGTETRVIGGPFAKVVNSEEFLCRFTSRNMDIPPKYVPGKYENSTSVICVTPGGWGSGIFAAVDIAFNKEEFSNSNKYFYFYSIYEAKPRSSPSGEEGRMIVYGSGFLTDANATCSFDNLESPALRITPTEIHCRIPKRNDPDFFGYVPLSINPNGNDINKFEGGFQYYPQITATDFYPLKGPAQGKGTINFYGSGFRGDFKNANPTCRFGKSTGKCTVLSQKEMKCKVPVFANTTESFVGEISLNNQSFVEVTSKHKYIPYTISSVTPSCAPFGSNSEVMVFGSGFPREDKRGKFMIGNSQSYSISETKIMSTEQMIARVPSKFELPKYLELPATFPVSIAFADDKFAPWTSTEHTFTFYKQQECAGIRPYEVKVGDLTDVYVYTSTSTPFLPTIDGKTVCKFGRFGSTTAELINSTTIRCPTPVIHEEADTIFREEVFLLTAMNGIDFNIENEKCVFTFVGTASYLIYWPYILMAVLLALLIILLIVMGSYVIRLCFPDKENGVTEGVPNTLRDDLGLMRPKAITKSKFIRSSRFQEQL